MGAWVETYGMQSDTIQARSHLTWVRGLKQEIRAACLCHDASHLTWVRGLKHSHSSSDYLRIEVAPYVGAWVETLRILVSFCTNSVAPYVGAWVETGRPSLFLNSKGSHLTWVRGLKL